MRSWPGRFEASAARFEQDGPAGLCLRRGIGSRIDLPSRQLKIIAALAIVDDQHSPAGPLHVPHLGYPSDAPGRSCHCGVGISGRRANADMVRRLTIVRPATGEVAYDVPFAWDGASYENGLSELDWLMRDVQAGQVKPIDLRVYDLLAMAQAEFGRPSDHHHERDRTEATND